MSLVARLWKTSKDGKIQYVTMGEDHMDGALAVIRESFLKNEPVSIVTRILQRSEAVHQMEHLCKLIAKDGASIAAVENATGRVVGVAFNKISNKDAISFLGNIRQEPDIDAGCAELIDFFKLVEGKVDVFLHYKVETLLDHMFLATHQDYYNRGIGSDLVSSTVELAKDLKRINAVIAIFTGPMSQKIRTRLGWDVFTEVFYDSLIYEGERYSDSLEPNVTKCVFTGTKLKI